MVHRHRAADPRRLRRAQRRHRPLERARDIRDVQANEFRVEVTLSLLGQDLFAANVASKKGVMAVAQDLSLSCQGSSKGLSLRTTQNDITWSAPNMIVTTETSVAEAIFHVLVGLRQMPRFVPGDPTVASSENFHATRWHEILAAVATSTWIATRTTGTTSCGATARRSRGIGSGRRFSEPVAVSSASPTDVPIAGTRRSVKLRPSRAPYSLQGGQYATAVGARNPRRPSWPHFFAPCDLRWPDGPAKLDLGSRLPARTGCRRPRRWGC